MMQSLRTIKSRIKGIENTQKITRAMQMVSSVKLTRAKNALYSMRPYFSRLEAMMGNMVSGIESVPHPLLEKRADIKAAALCVITSDAGLCSTYNQAVNRFAEDFIRRFGRERVRLITIGREGNKFFRKHGYEITRSYTEHHGRISEALAETLKSDLTKAFLAWEIDEAYIAYTHFGMTLRHKPVVTKILGIEFAPGPQTVYMAEPGIAQVLDALIPRYISERLRLILLDAIASEHSARMIAMKTATDNAQDLIESLVLLRNKVRQAGITKEVLEIAMAAEALKG
jgi:F-type H+-transporting ATPase subunit gamma